MRKTDDSVDLVYTWCDAADPVWNSKRISTAEACGLPVGDPANAKCRFAGNDEIKYALRSAEKCVPWVRKVFLVVDDDITLPSWLEQRHPKLRIVRLSEIMPHRFLPCFVSGTIEHHIARIPDLTDRFLYSNDDCMFYRPLKESFFFAKDGYPYFRFGGLKEPIPDSSKTNYHFNLDRADALAKSSFDEGVRGLREAMSRYPHHCVDAYLKTDLNSCYERFSGSLESTFSFPFRSPDKIQRVIYAYHAIATGHGHFRQARFRISMKRPWYKRLLRPGYADSLQFYGERWRVGESMLKKWKPGVFCFNDTEVTTDADREWVRSLYERMYPEPSSFERNEL